MTEVAAMLASGALMVVAGMFLVMWTRRANEDGLAGKRATPMGLYIAFGAFGFFVLLYGLGSAFRASAEGQNISNRSLVAVVVGLISMVVLLPPTRQMLAKVIPFDPKSWTDTIGLMIFLSISALAAFSLTADTESAPITYGMLIGTAVIEVALAFVVIGFPFVRKLKESLDRLGLVVPTGRQVAISLGLVLVSFVITATASLLMREFQPDLYTSLVENMDTTTSGIDVWWGAVLLGICAGVGEETIFRGAIQPRFGIILTALGFAALHQQYGLSFVTLGIFLMGIVFGLQRKYMNTTSAIITHAVYNTLAVLLPKIVNTDEGEALIHVIGQIAGRLF